VNTVWVLVGLGLLVAVVALITSWRRGSDASDMGAVSHQWLMEHRLGPGDSRR
jgi:uncharacterized membrane protein